MKTEELISEYSTVVRTLRKNKAIRFTKMVKYVCFLKEGFLKIAVMNKDGREAIKYLLQAGSFFGTTTLLDQTENADDYAVALEDAVIVFIDAEKMKQCMQTHPDIRQAVFQQLSQRIQKAENRLLSMIFQDARSRICEFLKELAVEFGKRSAREYEVKSFLTHDDIAKLTATSRQTVSSTLNHLREQKHIEYNNETLRLPLTSPLWETTP